MKMSALKKVLHDFWWVRKNWEAIAKQKRFWDGRAASNSKRYLNSEPAKEYPFHESNNSKEADIDDEPDEGPNPIDNVERRWCS